MKAITLKHYRLTLGITSVLTMLPLGGVHAADTTGLWMGMVEVNKVNQVHGELTEGEGADKVIMTDCVVYPDDSTAPCDPVAMPQPIPHAFHLQMVLHVDDAGGTKLLREAYLMQTKDDGINPISRLIVTDDNTLGSYDGIIRRNGKLVARRLSSTSFPVSVGANSLAVGGTIANDNTLSFTVNQAADHPTNPMRHQYHPMHQSGVDITRTVDITIKTPEAGNTVSPEVGLSEFHGEYLETLQGLHKSDLKVAGNIILRRINTIGVLDAVEAGE